MSNENIRNLWCDPCAYQDVKFSASELFSDDNPIAFMGGRGSGKTMFLKYWSYWVQTSDTESNHIENQPNCILEQLRKNGAVGLYIRIDGPKLRAFENRNLTEEMWETLFAHFFELTIAQNIFSILIDLESRGGLVRQDILLVKDLIEKTFSISNLNSLNDAGLKIDQLLQEIRNYLKKLILTNATFNTDVIFEISDISGDFLNKLKALTPKFKKIKFCLFIDEYENFLPYQQRLINTLVKFPKVGVLIRLGMRLEGFRTYHTITENEFIKVGRDYREVVFEGVLTNKGIKYKNFLRTIANLRLKNVDLLKDHGLASIEDILGSKESFEEEALEIVAKSGNSERHFKLLKGKATHEEIEILKHSLNPLIEMLNIVLVLRGNAPKDVASSMNSYLNEDGSQAARKYKMDYVDKYKLSLLLLLAKQYKEDKQYYSFNTIVYLSSGIVGNFIEICRRIFQIVNFEEMDELIEKGKVSNSLQTLACKEFSNSEFQMVSRISQHGQQLKQLVKNLGNIFMEYHRDQYIRYPELNQIAINWSEQTHPELLELFRSAKEWSILQRKQNLQTVTPGADKDEIFLLSKIFAPMFNLTYRTRGGVSEVYTAKQFEEKFKVDNCKSQLKSYKLTSKNSDGGQMELL